LVARSALARDGHVLFVDDLPAAADRETELGWPATITRSGADWLLGEARPALRP
jgi:hypothetical protein